MLFSLLQNLPKKSVKMKKSFAKKVFGRLMDEVERERERGGGRLKSEEKFD